MHPGLRRLLGRLRPHRRALIWGGLLVILTVILMGTPLFDVLGFEFAFAIGLLGSFAAADLAAARVRTERTSRPPTAGTRAAVAVFALTGRALVTNLALLVLPLVLIALNALRVRQCDWWTGIGLFFALPVLAMSLATATGAVCGLVLARRPRLAVAAAWLVVLGSIVFGIWRFYAAPPIFGYDPYASYFPGTLYDEDVSLGAPFAWARLYQLSFAAAALFLVTALLDVPALAVRLRPPRDRPVVASLGVVFAAITIWIRANAAEHGFAVDAADIQEHLGGRIETEHFVIHYPRGAHFAPDMPAIAREHEHRWRQLARTLGVAPRARIHSYYFASANEKHRWMGARNTYIAKPWRHEIYIQHEDFPHDTLRHEIAHVFAAEFGDPLFKVSVKYWGWPPLQFNPGMIEGIAVAADWPGGGRLTPHQAVKAMRELGFLPPIRRVLAPGFFQFAAVQSYTTAGSFARFLLDTYGAEKLRALYQAGGTPADFKSIYGKSLAELAAGWEAVVAAQPLDEGDLEIARDRYRRRSIFQRPCPHAIARRAGLAEEAIGKGDVEEAARLMRRICRDDPHDPGHFLALGKVLERAGDVLSSAPYTAEAAATYRKVADDGEQPAPVRARALLALVDLLGSHGDLAGARAALDAAATLPVDESTRRNLGVRALALSPEGAGGLDPAAAEALRAYLFAWLPRGREPDPVLLMNRARTVAAHEPTRALGQYFVGRLLAARSMWPDAAVALAEAHRLGLADPLVARENDRLLAQSAFLAGDLDAARAAATRLTAASHPLTTQAEGADWLERIDFAATSR